SLWAPAACMGVGLTITEPAGFPTSDRAFRGAGMAYLDAVRTARHASFAAFEAWRGAAKARLILFTTRADTPYLDHAFQRGDVLLFGRESAGVPEHVHRAADVRLVIPMRGGMRSLHLAMAAAMAVGAAIRPIGNARPTKPGLAH